MDSAIAAAQETGVEPLTNIFLSQGVMGAIVIALVYFIMMLRAELRDVRAAHKTEIAAKDSLILELQEDRLKEAKIGYDVANSTKVALDALLVAIRQKGP